MLQTLLSRQSKPSLEEGNIELPCQTVAALQQLEIKLNEKFTEKVMESVRRNIHCKNSTDKHIEGAMREWFRKDGDWKGGRNKRKQNQIQEATRLQTEFESVLTYN
ncbi:hypothetical protein LSH36_1403g00001 [Paralvinella palmiformis]|uniref:Uncharacterized protein n=1 Tax=Paralvinella palmiformis TaxID=53620 RepID=A0AAD9ITH3_9ANNE|nr:hypothetical protein LSH36_1403g00001 [Paralvinella palmiformis]